MLYRFLQILNILKFIKFYVVKCMSLVVWGEGRKAVRYKDGSTVVVIARDHTLAHVDPSPAVHLPQRAVGTLPFSMHLSVLSAFCSVPTSRRQFICYGFRLIC